MSKRIEVCKKEELEAGCGKAFPVGDRMIAVFLHEGKYYAMDDFCPHMGASLAGGWIYENTVACPWHAWRFGLEDGCWVDNPKIKTEVYPVIEEDGKLLVELPD